jgi:hypothetical protein
MVNGGLGGCNFYMKEVNEHNEWRSLSAKCQQLAAELAESKRSESHLRALNSTLSQTLAGLEAPSSGDLG